MHVRGRKYLGGKAVVQLMPLPPPPPPRILAEPKAADRGCGCCSLCHAEHGNLLIWGGESFRFSLVCFVPLILLAQSFLLRLVICAGAAANVNVWFPFGIIHMEWTIDCYTQCFTSDPDGSVMLIILREDAEEPKERSRIPGETWNWFRTVSSVPS